MFVCVISFSVGILCFGLTSPRSLAIACGILVAAWGVSSILIAMKVGRANFCFFAFIQLNIFSRVGFQWPEYFDKKEKYIP